MARLSSTFVRPPRQMLQRRLSLLAMENVSTRNNAAVRRVLELLSNDNLTDVAARSPGADKITLECGVIGKAWEDTRVVNRINQLSRQGVSVDRETITTHFGDAELVRERLVVKF